MFDNFKKSFLTILDSPHLFSGDLEKFEKLFRQNQDPWNFNSSAYEKKRFSMIMEFVGPIKPQSILELGCAEGHLTKYLWHVCHNIEAVDISKTAIQRVEKIVPGVKFILGDFTKMNFPKKFSLIVASEVLYYLKEREIIRFFENCQTDYLLTANFWNLFKKKENLIRKYHFKKIKDRWVFHFEFGFPFPKITHICLWKKS